MNRQEVFDRVVRFLLKQGKPAREPGSGSCCYRTSDGLKCAVGCLIADEHYSPDLEGSFPYHAVLQNALGKSGVVVKEDEGDDSFLRAAQRVHDGYDSSAVGFSDYLRAEYTKLAGSYGLSDAVCREAVS